MSSAPLERLKEIFHSARELPPSERDAFLTGACGSDEQLRREIEALLESDRAADDFIADPPAQIGSRCVSAGSPDPSEAGRMIGQYKLLECIGSGGMGAVYLAERADQQFQMQVAIKLIKRGMDTDSVLRRFQHERQILASLEHPNIARLLDGGTTEDGVPYFVMEYIEGHRIDRYAEEHQLSISERLDLFRQVCGAVSYAHQHLVVHRDLKPSNILVTPAGVPKLLDFGIAKIIQPNDSAETLPTITAVPIMTPEYASPEQIEGAPATTLSDVYSLGAVLYELLAGQPPYRLQEPIAPGNREGDQHRANRETECGGEPPRRCTPAARRSRQHRAHGDAKRDGAPLPLGRTVLGRHPPSPGGPASRRPARHLVVSLREISAAQPAGRFRRGPAFPHARRRHCRDRLAGAQSDNTGTQSPRGTGPRRAAFQRGAQAGQ